MVSEYTNEIRILDGDFGFQIQWIHKIVEFCGALCDRHSENCMDKPHLKSLVLNNNGLWKLSWRVVYDLFESGVGYNTLLATIFLNEKNLRGDKMHCSQNIRYDFIR